MATKTTKKTVKKAVAKKVITKRAPRKVVAKVVAPKKEKKVLGALEAQVFSTTGAQLSVIKLPEEVFGVKWNGDLVHQVVLGMQANARPTVANTKFRGEVSGGGIKPWKQKGTGRARHGSRRSPIWKGGGTTHGPRAERDYTVKINKKMRTAALMSLLSRKFRDGEVVFVEALSFAKPSTKSAVAVLGAIAKGAGAETLATKKNNAALLAFSSKNEMAEKSFRNINSIVFDEIRNINPVDLITKKFLVIENPAVALPVLASRLTK